MEGSLHRNTHNKSNLIEDATPASTRSKKNTSDSCVICLEPISERAITVPCNHYAFDFLCIASWLQERSTCPLCNAELIAIQYDWRAPYDFKTYNVPRRDAPVELGTSNSHLRTRSNRRGGGRIRERRDPWATPAPGLDVALQRRRRVYERKRYSLHVGSNRLSRYRPHITPAAFAASSSLQSQARAWMRRELRVFAHLDPFASSNGEAVAESSSGGRRTNNLEFLLEYIVSVLRTVDLKSGQMEGMLEEFLGRDNASLFVHELGAWLKSPFTRVEDWDRMVQYREELSNARAT